MNYYLRIVLLKKGIRKYPKMYINGESYNEHMLFFFGMFVGLSFMTSIDGRDMDVHAEFNHFLKRKIKEDLTLQEFIFILKICSNNEDRALELYLDLLTKFFELKVETK